MYLSFRPFLHRKEKYFLFIVDNEDNYSAGEITKLAEIIELAMGMWKYTPERDLRAANGGILLQRQPEGEEHLAVFLDDAVFAEDQLLTFVQCPGISRAGASVEDAADGAIL